MALRALPPKRVSGIVEATLLTARISTSKSTGKPSAL